MTAAGTLEHLVTSDPAALALMGFDVARLRSLRTEARSLEHQLELMGFDVDRLRFYRWLAQHEPLANHNV